MNVCLDATSMGWKTAILLAIGRKAYPAIGGKQLIVVLPFEGWEESFSIQKKQVHKCQWRGCGSDGEFGTVMGIGSDA